MILAPHEQLFLSAAAGWVACALCFWLIPSWRVRDIHRMRTSEVTATLVQCSEELRRRAPVGAFEKVDLFIGSMTDDEKTRLGESLFDRDKKSNG